MKAAVSNGKRSTEAPERSYEGLSGSDLLRAYRVMVTSRKLDDTFELDLFAPIRQDWLDHTDAYFHRK